MCTISQAVRWSTPSCGAPARAQCRARGAEGGARGQASASSRCTPSAVSECLGRSQGADPPWGWGGASPDRASMARRPESAEVMMAAGLLGQHCARLWVGGQRQAWLETLLHQQGLQCAGDDSPVVLLQGVKGGGRGMGHSRVRVLKRASCLLMTGQAGSMHPFHQWRPALLFVHRHKQTEAVIRTSTVAF